MNSVFPNTIYAIQHLSFEDLGSLEDLFYQLAVDLSHNAGDAENKKVSCYGSSYSLNLKSEEDDTKEATKQVFGIDAMLALL